MDKIDMTMARVKKVITTKDVTETQAGLAELKMLVEHVPKKEALTLDNIL